MIDTHTHLYMTEFFPDGGIEAVKRAVEAGVDMMVLPAVDRESVKPLLSLHAACPVNTAVALGLHPTEVEADWREELEWILTEGSDIDLVGIGETGIDLHYGDQSLQRQMDAFGEQIQIALDRGLPVIVHSRDAIDETVEVVRSFERDMPRIVFHSFTYGVPEMEKLIKYAPEAYFGINGVVTFKNAPEVQDAVRNMPVDRLLTETDAPFLSPVPFRGKTNESSNIPYIIRKIAELRKVDEETIKVASIENARRFFGKI